MNYIFDEAVRVIRDCGRPALATDLQDEITKHWPGKLKAQINQLRIHNESYRTQITLYRSFLTRLRNAGVDPAILKDIEVTERQTQALRRSPPNDQR